MIFMHRQFSLQPFSRHYSHSTHPFLDFLDIGPPGDAITVRAAERAQLLRVLAEYKAVQRAGTLLTLTFVTVNDYLWLLRAVSQELSVLGRSSLYYLAAAVSDFFLPRQKMVRAVPVPPLPAGARRAHAIHALIVRAQDPVGKGQLAHRDGPGAEDPQTSGGGMDPRGLHCVLQGPWAPARAYLCPAHLPQLETDEELLIPKARQALARYGHQVVIGNDLHRRKFEVVFVGPKAGGDSAETVYEESWLRIDLVQNPLKEIEEDIVAELVNRHELWIARAVASMH